MNLEGTWTNQLGSTLVIDSVTDGMVAGSYTTAVSTGSCAKGSFVIAGRTDVDTGGTSVGWTVAWKNDASWCYSVSSWVAQFNAEQGTLTAFWLLATQTPEGPDWASTNIGVDYFWSGTEQTSGPKSDKPLGVSHP